MGGSSVTNSLIQCGQEKLSTGAHAETVLRWRKLKEDAENPGSLMVMLGQEQGAKVYYCFS